MRTWATELCNFPECLGFAQKLPSYSSPRLRVSAVELFFLRVLSVSQCRSLPSSVAKGGGFCLFRLEESAFWQSPLACGPAAPVCWEFGGEFVGPPCVPSRQDECG